MRLVLERLEYDGASRGPLGLLYLLFKHPDAYGFAFQLLHAAANGSQDTCLARNDRQLSDYLIWHLCSQTLQLPTRQYNLTNPAAIPRSLQYRASQHTVQFSTSTRRPSSLQYLFTIGFAQVLLEMLTMSQLTVPSGT